MTTDADWGIVEEPRYHVVTIWLNVQLEDGRLVGFEGYEPGHTMTPVFVYVDNRANWSLVLSHAMKLFNADEDILSPEDVPTARRYRANRLRSLSVGDVIQIDHEFFVVERIGFNRLGTNTDLADYAHINVWRNPLDNFETDAASGPSEPRPIREPLSDDPSDAPDWYPGDDDD